MKRLGDILVESGFLNATELAEVLSIQKETGKRLGEVIVESGLMSEFDILRAVSSQYNYPMVEGCLVRMKVGRDTTRIDFLSSDLAIP